MSETSLKFILKDGMIYTKVEIPDGKEEEIVKIVNKLTSGELVPFILADIDKLFTETKRENKFEEIYTLIREVYAINVVKIVMQNMNLIEKEDEEDDSPVIDPEAVFGISHGVQNAT